MAAPTDATDAAERLAGPLWDATVASRSEAADLGARFAQDQAAAFGYRIPPPPKPGYPPESVKTVIREEWRGPDAADAIVTRLETHVRTAYRQTVINAAETLDDLDDFDVDPLMSDARGSREIGWARVLGNRDNHCAFCVMLASRGPVYATAEAAGQRSAREKWLDATGFTNSYHDNCGCQVVLVVSDQASPAAAQQAAAAAIYDEALRRIQRRTGSRATGGKTYRTNLVLQEIDRILRERAEAGTPAQIPAAAA